MAEYSPSCDTNMGIKALFLSGSVLFLLGSILFYPGLQGCPYYTCLFWGAFSFIIGSTLAFAGSVLLMRKNFERLKRGNIMTMCSDPVANGLFIIGSVFFLPSITKVDGVIEGVLFFTVGCVILVLNSLLNIHITLSCHDVDRDAFLLILAREICLIIGSLLFIVGSIMFVPLFFHQYVVNFFIIGSIFFILNHSLFFCSTTNASNTTTKAGHIYAPMNQQSSGSDSNRSDSNNSDTDTSSYSSNSAWRNAGNGGARDITDTNNKSGAY